MLRTAAVTAGIVILSLPILSLPATAQVTAADVETLTLNLHPSGRDGGKHPVRVTFDGTFYRDGRLLWRGGQSAGDLQGPDLTLERLSRAYTEGTLEDVLALWAPEERGEQRPRLERSFEWNRDNHRKIESSSLWAEILYGEYRLLTVRHELEGGRVVVSTYPLVRQGEEYFLTQALASDVVYQTLYLKLREMLSLEASEMKNVAAPADEDRTKEKKEIDSQAAS